MVRLDLVGFGVAWSGLVRFGKVRLGMVRHGLVGCGKGASAQSMIEKHYRVKELVELLGYSSSTIINLFSKEPGVLRLTTPSDRRTYTTMSIPESVVERVRSKLMAPPLEVRKLPRRILPVVKLEIYKRMRELRRQNL